MTARASASILVSGTRLPRANQHGLLLIPQEIAAGLSAAADKTTTVEQEFIHWVRSPALEPESCRRCAQTLGSTVTRNGIGKLKK